MTTLKTKLSSKISYGRILVPYDRSDLSDRALKHAIYLSKVCGAEIVILNIIKSSKNMQLVNIRKELEDIARFCRVEGVSEVSYIIREGKPLNEIVDVLEERAYDLIIMGSSNISSLAILGSISRKVIARIRKPILIIPERFTQS
jgi:nucleotide-binding universal stress UspA family protein